MDTIHPEELIETEAQRLERERADKPTLPGVSPVEPAAGQRLRSYIERIERLNEELKGLQDDVKDIFAESKAFGFNVPTLRQIIKLRKMDAEKRREAQALLDTYCAAIGLE